MTFPTITTELALTTRPTEAPAWIDVSAYVYSIRIRRGRTSERQQPERGTCEVILDNSTRRFDPAYTAGPYYGYLKPLRRIRVTATFTVWISSTSYITWSSRIFTGYVDGWPQSWEEDGTWPLVKLTASDGMKILELCELNTSFPQQRTDERISAVLDEVGWTVGGAWVLDSATNSQLGSTTILAPNGDRVLFRGNTTVVAADLENANALQHILDVAASEDGLFFIGGDGAAYFYNRHWRTHPNQMNPVASFGDATGEVGYLDYELTYSDRDIYNDVRCTRQDGEEQTASDITSQVEYFKRTLAEDRNLSNSDLEMADRANWLVARYKNPQWYAESIRFVLGAETRYGDMSWKAIDRELNDRIQITRRPQGGTSIVRDYHILSIEHQIGLRSGVGGQRWEIRWILAPTDPITTYWHLTTGSDAYVDYSKLGITTILNY